MRGPHEEASAPGAASIPHGDGGGPLGGLTGRTGVLMAGGYPISEFPRFLSGQVQRVVVDRTGLTGEWDFDLRFTPTPLTTNDAPSTEASSLFTALQEQLGLNWNLRAARVDVLVIERIEPPAPD